MVKITDVRVEDLQAALERVEEKTPTLRLLTAIAYKHGATQTELARWCGVERKTIYNWLSRFEADPEHPVRAAKDAPRPGRPSKLSDTQRRQLDRALRQPPAEVGYDAASWSPSLVRRFLRDVFDAEYSLEAARRFLREPAARRPAD